MVSWTSDPADVGPAGRADDEVLVDGELVSAQAPGAGAVSVTLAEGQHTVGVRTTDRNGNASVTTRSVLVDGTPPAAPELVAQAPGDQVPAGPVTLRWNSAADDAPGGSGRGDDVVSIDGAEVARVPAGVGTVTVTLGEGTHAWSVRSLDLVGNASEATGQVAVGPAPADAAPAATDTAPATTDAAPPATDAAPPAEATPPVTDPGTPG
jgi:hypothetical protein